MLDKYFKTVIEQDFAVAYLRLLGEFYYKKITVTKLVETAGYGRATFYAYFKCLRDLRTKLQTIDLNTTDMIFTKTLRFSDERERKQIVREYLTEHMRFFWPLLFENNLPQHAVDMKEQIKKVIHPEFARRFYGDTFETAFVEDFCISGMLRMLVSYYSKNGDMITPQNDEELVKVMYKIIFQIDNKIVTEKFGGIN